jgi:hypothetical protein
MVVTAAQILDSWRRSAHDPEMTSDLSGAKGEIFNSQLKEGL